MRRKKGAVWVAIIVLAITLLHTSSPSYAQDYSFSLDQEIVDVDINSDGSVRLEYWLTFTCDSGASPIDVIDLGLPNNDFGYSDIQADVDGKSVSRVDSDYQGEGGYGVAVWLGNAQILPGRRGTVHITVARVGRMLYQDTSDADYASIQFSPVWFDSRFTHGSTAMTVRFHLPAGVEAEEPRWHDAPAGWSDPAAYHDGNGRIVYEWSNPAAEPDRQYIFGASFPARVVSEGAIQRGPSAIEQLFSRISAIARTVGVVLCNPASIMIIVFTSLAFLGNWSQRRRKMQYLPPSIKVEGVGIKRGLTAVEAAILLETPLNKVLTMILFGLLKKGAVTVLDDQPFKIKANEPKPDKLHYYEEQFLAAITKSQTLSEKGLREMMVNLVRAVNTKMKSFSRQESVAYYRDIVRRAWAQVEAAETPELRSRRYDEGLEYLMLDKDFDDRTERVFQRGPVWVPMWWGYHRPWARAIPALSQPGPAAAPGAVQLPTLPGADFAAKMARGIESTAGGIVRSVTDFTSKITSVTNPLPKTSSSGRSFKSSGGGSSCACACACACAGCACACAGGGR